MGVCHKDEKQTHQERHIFLHKCFDELAADFIQHTGQLLSEVTVLQLLQWSDRQTLSPTETEELNNEYKTN